MCLLPSDRPWDACEDPGCSFYMMNSYGFFWAFSFSSLFETNVLVKMTTGQQPQFSSISVFLGRKTASFPPSENEAPIFHTSPRILKMRICRWKTWSILENSLPGGTFTKFIPAYLQKVLQVSLQLEKDIVITSHHQPFTGFTNIFVEVLQCQISLLILPWRFGHVWCLFVPSWIWLVDWLVASSDSGIAGKCLFFEDGILKNHRITLLIRNL